MDSKLGVYLCGGCGIADGVDLSRLSELAVEGHRVDMCRSHPFLCSAPGVRLIRKDIEAGINTLVLAACSSRFKQEVFSFAPSIVLERVNLREHVVWSHRDGDEDVQMLAADYLRMGMAKAQKVSPAEPYAADVTKAILVVGGGMAGMTAALDAARAGYHVYLVEKEPSLGGMMAKLYRQYPNQPPYRELQETGVQTRVAEVCSNPNITVLVGAEVERAQGSPGAYHVSIRAGNDSTPVKVGAIVLATGSRPYQAERLTHLAFGNADVITNLQMEELARGDRIRRPSDGREVETVAFIQCAGQRDANHLPYCSSVCCLTSLKQALYVVQKNPGARAYIFYKDMRAPHLYEDFYKRVQEEKMVFLTRGEVRKVTPGQGGLMVEVDNSLLGDSIAVKADLVVLATGMVPSSMPPDPDGKNDPDSGLYAGTALRLAYRQGPELPTLRYGFTESHFICFPFETRRTGVYAAGCVRQPMDSAAAREDGAGAACKAIQCVELAARGEAAHPRVGDITYPELYMQRCTQCKRCTEECPFGMYDEDEKFNPLPNPTRCRRCAICMGSCPERIISFQDYSVDIVASMVKAIEVPGEEEEKPRILAFACENDAYPALDAAGRQRLSYNAFVRVVPVRCLGSVNMVWIADALSRGIDGVLLIGCKYGDDYQCHFVKGSELANYRLGKLQETLQRLALEPQRVSMVQLSISEYALLPRVFDDFLEKVRGLGPNPYKGF